MMDWASIVAGIAGLIVGWSVRIVWERRKLELEHKLQIMREMTAAFHSLGHQYYNPLAQAAYDLKKVLAQGDEPESSFFRLAKFWRRYENMPILQLRCGHAEDTFVMVVGKIRALLRVAGEFSEEDFDRLQGGDMNQKLVDFRADVQTDSQLRHIFSKYTCLIGQKQNELEDLMQCLSDTIFMEMNCGKEPWYSREELWKQASQTLERFNGLSHIDRDVRPMVTQYYEELMRTYQKRWYQKRYQDIKRRENG